MSCQLFDGVLTSYILSCVLHDVDADRSREISILLLLAKIKTGDMLTSLHLCIVFVFSNYSLLWTIRLLTRLGWYGILISHQLQGFIIRPCERGFDSWIAKTGPTRRKSQLENATFLSIFFRHTTSTREPRTHMFGSPRVSQSLQKYLLSGHAIKSDSKWQHDREKVCYWDVRRRIIRVFCKYYTLSLAPSTFDCS